MSFVNLHIHSENSLLDGVGTVKEIVKKAKEQGSPAIAITDHGNVNAAVQLYQECKEQGIKPIFGSEFYFGLNAEEKQGGNMHLIVLAKNTKGFENLLKLNGWAHRVGFYRKPRIDFKRLKEFREGLIILSGCTSGIIAKKLIDGNYDAALEWAEKFKKVFGEDYYLEMQVHDYKEQRVVNKGLIKISEKLKIKTVITNDAHYVNEEDGLLQDVMALIKQKKTWKDRQDALDRIKRGEDANMPWELGCKQLWMKDIDEMTAAWKEWHKDYMDRKVLDRSIAETVKLAEKIDNIAIDATYKFPNIDSKKSIDDTFQEMLDEGFKWRGFTKADKEPVERIKYEHKILKDLGLLPYFVILSDAIKEAKRKDIMVGVGRGSAAGSLVCYCLGITGVNPLDHGLMFERFISPARKDMPDIDVDFESERKGEIEEYLISKYGEDKVGHVATYGMMQLRSAIKDVSRVMGGDSKATNELTAVMPKDIDKEVKTKYVKLKDFKAAFNEHIEKFLSAHENHERILKVAWKLKGRIRHISQHPAGIVITPKPLDHLVALQRHGGKLLIGWTEGQRKELTPFGFVKYDILGLKTLDILKRALKLVKKRHLKDVDIEKIPLDDKKVYKRMSKGQSLGSFQFETEIMMLMLRELRPDQFSDLAALNALDRPGPLRMNMDKVFYDLKHGVENKNTKKMVKTVMRKMFPETYGVVLYQEQVMMAAMNLSGFSVIEADDMRRTITKNVGKFDKPEVKKLLDEVKDKFISRATKKIGADDAKFVWEIIFKFTEYGFNKAHSVSYAMIGYQCMWLKVNYPIEFFTAMLQWSKGKDTEDYMEDAAKYDIKVLPVDINRSGTRFKPEKDAIRYPLGHIRDVKKAAVRIIEEKYESFDDFLSKIHGKRVNKKAILSLIKAGAFDKFEDRAKLYYRYLRLKEKPKLRDKIKDKKWDVTTRLKMEKEAYDFEFSTHLLDDMMIKLGERLGLEEIDKVFEQEAGYQAHVGGIIRSVREHRAKNGVMAFVDFQYKAKRTSITIFGDRWSALKYHVKPGALFYGDLTVNEYREKKSFIMSSRGGAENFMKVLQDGEL